MTPVMQRENDTEVGWLKFVVRAPLLLVVLGIVVYCVRVYNPKLAFLETTFYILGSMFLVFLLASILILAWWKLRGALSTTKSYLLLFFLGILMFSGFSVLTFATYKISPSSFRISNEIESELKKGAASALEESKKITTNCRAIAKALDALPPKQIRPRKQNRIAEFIKSLIGTGTRALEVGTDLSGWELRIKETVTQLSSGEHCSYYLVAERESEEITIESYHYKRMPRPSLASGEVSSRFLASAFRDRARYEEEYIENKYSEIVSSPGLSGAVSMWLFLYQGIMQFLGSDPEYIRPADFTTRLFSLVFTLLRYLYVALVLAFVVQAWSRPNR